MLKLLRIILILVALVAVFWIGAIMSPAEAQAPTRDFPADIQGNDLKEFAYTEVVKKWGESEWGAFHTIIAKESSWRVFGYHYQTGYTKTGIKSTARGLGGLLDSTFRSVGYEPTDDPETQILATIEYISKRYKTPTNAVVFHRNNGWY